MNDLNTYLEAALDSGGIPNPIDGESMASFRMRVAHAGAIIGAKWITDRNEALAAAHPEPEPEPDDGDWPVNHAGKPIVLEAVD